MKKLYLILARELDRVKIGLSENPELRLKQLQTGSPSKLDLFAFKPSKNASIQERELHEQYKEKIVHGEWFQLKPIDYVKLLKKWNYDVGIHYSKRNIEALSIGCLAYFSWDSKSLCKVKVTGLDKRHADVEIIEKIGTRIGNIGAKHYFFLDEVRQHPIDALINRVTM